MMEGILIWASMCAHSSVKRHLELRSCSGVQVLGAFSKWEAPINPRNMVMVSSMVLEIPGLFSSPYCFDIDCP